MKIVDPVQTVFLPSRFRVPKPRAWRRIEDEGGVRLSEYARQRIRKLVVTYAVATFAVKGTPRFEDVRTLLKDIVEAAEAYTDPGDTADLVSAIAALQADGSDEFIATIYWAEAKGVDLLTLLLKLQTGHRPASSEVRDLAADAERVLSHVDEEILGQQYGPRNEVGPYYELLKVLLPMYRRRGGKIEDVEHTTKENTWDAPPLVCFVYEVCNQLFPDNWPDRSAFVSSHVTWSGRIKKFLTAKPLIARKPR